MLAMAIGLVCWLTRSIGARGTVSRGHIDVEYRSRQPGAAARKQWSRVARRRTMIDPDKAALLRNSHAGAALRLDRARNFEGYRAELRI
ncbi:hypothetical protein Sala_2458 [Sphingopyxis alaskensis RB2256]|uniref:Uncharacterized protein n=1 Tax=Sphingopyxis alaskensis (strain DSM 13593 / LMG 18877 / RB2256) TaxID=317655 RepID=Q1GQA7_SPHAL|nr:hypothetical protein Sala_2458 [Sphingopyxis alaskensis RB2256]